MEKEITTKDIEGFSKAFNKQESNLLAEDTVIKNGVTNSATNQTEKKKFVDAFSTEVEAGLITDQKRSGRCWMFAATNVMRVEVMKNLNIENMELSQAFTLFYDKLEKSNIFLENVFRTFDEPLGSRLLDFLLTDPVQDGGQWTMIVNIIKKYGICPKDAYPESFSSSNTTDLDKYLNLLLRGDAAKLRKEHEKGTKEAKLRKEKDTMMEEIYRVIAISLGEPPKTFDYEYVDKDKKYHRISEITPKEFFDKYVGLALDDYVSILNCPSPKRPLNHTITVSYLNNVEGGDKVLYLNLPIERVKELCVNQLKDGNVVWFGSDVGQFELQNEGILSPEAIDVDKLFNVEFALDKGERVDYGESLMTHAMVLTGVNINEKTGEIERWKVENSWGDKVGFKGYFIASDKWFTEFVFQAVINKKYLNEQELEILKEDPIVLEPWDPMGSLA